MGLVGASGRGLRIGLPRRRVSCTVCVRVSRVCCHCDFCVEGGGRREEGWRRGQHTSCSPTSTCTVLPLGMTCATSPSFTTAESLPLPNCTRRASSTSGLKRPPDRSLERSPRKRSIVFAISSSRAPKSEGSSLALDAAGVLAEEGDEADSRDASRAALPPFF